MIRMDYEDQKDEEDEDDKDRMKTKTLTKKQRSQTYELCNRFSGIMYE